MRLTKKKAILVLSLLCLLCLAGCKKAEGPSIIINRMDITAQAPTSSAVIEDMGVSLTANQPHHDEAAAKPGDTVYCWCKVSSVDIGTNMAVTLLRDNESVKVENLAINRDMILYMEYDIEEDGEYDVLWRLTNKDATSFLFTIKNP